jgi:hypothetical protein
VVQIIAGAVTLGEGLAVKLASKAPKLMKIIPRKPIKGMGDASKIPWGKWSDYNKVTVNGREYAQVGDRLYTQHAVERMQPSGMRYTSETAGGKVGASRTIEAGQKDYGRSISPNFIEDVISNGKLIDSPIVNGVQRQVWKSGSVEVVTEGNIVITIITK